MEINTRSTSRKTAIADPIVLRETDRVRLVFLPTLVENSTDARDSVRGAFVYQKKAAGSDWAAAETVSLGSLKSGEGFKLELHAGELGHFGRAVKALYQLHRQQGIPQGTSRFVKLDGGLARFLALSDSDLKEFLEARPKEAAAAFSRLLKWMAAPAHGSDLAAQLSAIDPEVLPGLVSALGLARVKAALQLWRANDQNGGEEFWQVTLSQNAYVLSQLFAYPIVVIREKAYLGGKGLDNSGGKVVDFLTAIESTDAVGLIEIKTPITKLLGAKYRSTYPLSQELNGGIAQALQYRQTLMRKFDSLGPGEKALTLGEPRCLILAGDARRELRTADTREAFELQRERIHGVTIVTYDELFRRLEWFVHLLEGRLEERIESRNPIEDM